MGEGELGPHLTQCGRARGLRAGQISSWSIQPFGHSAPTSQADRTDRQTGPTGQTTVWYHRANGFYKRSPKNARI